ncbi:Copia protein, partial [Mucuna pruriens]
MQTGLDPLLTEINIWLLYICLGKFGHLEKQNTNVVASSAKAKYRAMAQGVSEILWLKRILEELQLPMTLPMKLYCDNKVAISISQNLVQHDQTKHVEIDRHFKKEMADPEAILSSC